jgi:threonine/homoserine/homoserine lactone efflux protein
VLFNTAAWYGFVAALFSRPAFQDAYTQMKQTLDRIAGALLAAFGLRLILARDH